MNAQRVRTAMVLLFLERRRKIMVCLMTRPGRFTHGKEARQPLYGRQSRLQRRSGWLREISPTWNLIPGLSSPQPVAIPTTLSLEKLIFYFVTKKLIVGLYVYSAELLPNVNKHSINTHLLFRTFISQQSVKLITLNEIISTEVSQDVL